MNVFLEEKEFVGCGGLNITDEVRLTIAAQACLLLLNRKSAYFPGFTTILVYPETYVTTETRKDGLIESVGKAARAGESWHRGPVVLSWGDVLRGASRERHGFNVVLHEFAHKLDEENGISDGLPVLEDSARYQAWSEILNREFQVLQVQAERGENEVLDGYGAKSPSEFFAVATEAFFEKPSGLIEKHPLLYDELKNFYKLDPCRWIEQQP
jgi:Mlc titration factor MtfA (ptsG expression regulator)